MPFAAIAVKTYNSVLHLRVVAMLELISDPVSWQYSNGYCCGGLSDFCWLAISS